MAEVDIVKMWKNKVVNMFLLCSNKSAARNEYGKRVRKIKEVFNAPPPIQNQLRCKTAKFIPTIRSEILLPKMFDSLDWIRPLCEISSEDVKTGVISSRAVKPPKLVRPESGAYHESNSGKKSLLGTVVMNSSEKNITANFRCSNLGFFIP
jgi:hypothetical protein